MASSRMASILSISSSCSLPSNSFGPAPSSWERAGISLAHSLPLALSALTLLHLLHRLLHLLLGLLVLLKLLLHLRHLLNLLLRPGGGRGELLALLPLLVGLRGLSHLRHG